MLYIKYFYRVATNNYHPGSILIKNMPKAHTIYDIKNMICVQLREKLNRGFDVYQIEILSIEPMGQVA